MKRLTLSEIGQAQALIEKLPAGVYVIKEIYGDQWNSVSSPTSFGAKFKATVEAGLLTGIQVGKLKSDNHRKYTIE